MPARPCSERTQWGWSGPPRAPGCCCAETRPCARPGAPCAVLKAPNPTGRAVLGSFPSPHRFGLYVRRKALPRAQRKEPRRLHGERHDALTTNVLLCFQPPQPAEPSAELRSPGAPRFEAAQRLTASLWHFLMSSSFRASRLRAEQGAAQRGAGSPRRDRTGRDGTGRAGPRQPALTCRPGPPRCAPWAPPAACRGPAWAGGSSGGRPARASARRCGDSP